MESTKEEDDQNLTDPIEEKQESLAVRRRFNTGLITGDETRDSLSKDLISKVDKVQRCLTKLKTLSQNANEISIQRILSEVKTLNLSRYTGEVAESIAKIQFAIFKDGDQSNDSYYPCLILMTKICEIMHVRYDDFQKQLSYNPFV